ncbi:MAG TPA: flagellar basal body rod protein FlgB [Bdellovibrionota bacterium]|jgi:flagellar basal-body rod protein FlgB|nr:flagellar basal body rod protein FlgB [Bdellovibrionota bacterium]
MADSIFDPTIGALNTSLNLRLANQNVISSNIANADTPGYKAKAMEFESAFREAIGAGDRLPMDSTNPNHMVPQPTDPIQPEIYEEPNGVESLDGNTVNRSNEMSKMAENQLMYDSSVEMMKRKLGMLKYAITEGGGNR